MKDWSLPDFWWRDGDTVIENKLFDGVWWVRIKRNGTITFEGPSQNQSEHNSVSVLDRVTDVINSCQHGYSFAGYVDVDEAAAKLIDEKLIITEEVQAVLDSALKWQEEGGPANFAALDQDLDRYVAWRKS